MCISNVVFVVLCDYYKPGRVVYKQDTTILTKLEYQID